MLAIFPGKHLTFRSGTIFLSGALSSAYHRRFILLKIIWLNCIWLYGLNAIPRPFFQPLKSDSLAAPQHCSLQHPMVWHLQRWLACLPFSVITCECNSVNTLISRWLITAVPRCCVSFNSLFKPTARSTCFGERAQHCWKAVNGTWRLLFPIVFGFFQRVVTKFIFKIMSCSIVHISNLNKFLCGLPN